MPYKLNIFTGNWDLVGGTSSSNIKTARAIENPDGTLKTFTVPESYKAKSLSVFINGNKEYYITEISATQFTIDAAPLTGDIIDLIYAI